MTGFERITWFYRELKKNKYPDRRQFLETFEVSESTFKRDLSFLRDRLGAPVDFDSERRGYFLSEHGFELPPLWLDHRQLLIIAAVCRQLEEFTTSPVIKSLHDRFLEMITQCDSPHNIFSFENAVCVSCDNENFDILSQALLMESLIKITYQDGKNGAVTNREVEPYRLHNYAGSWYLIGFCRLRRAARNFQLRRIIELRVLDELIPDRRFIVDDYIHSAFGIFKGSSIVPAVLRFSPRTARLVREQCWHPEQDIRLQNDGYLLLTIPVADLTEIRMRTLYYGSEVEVLAPLELRRQVAAEAAAMQNIYTKK